MAKKGGSGDFLAFEQAKLVSDHHGPSKKLAAKATSPAAPSTAQRPGALSSALNKLYKLDCGVDESPYFIDTFVTNEVDLQESQRGPNEEPGAVELKSNAVSVAASESSAVRVRAARQRDAAVRAIEGKQWAAVPKRGVANAELKADLRVLQLRAHLDPKRHYKRADRNGLDPLTVQVGTVVAGAADFYADRLANRDRKATLVDEVLADTDRRRALKRRFSELQKKSTSGNRRAFERGRKKRFQQRNKR